VYFDYKWKPNCEEPTTWLWEPIHQCLWEFSPKKHQISWSDFLGHWKLKQTLMPWTLPVGISCFFSRTAVPHFGQNFKNQLNSKYPGRRKLPRDTWCWYRIGNSWVTPLLSPLCSILLLGITTCSPFWSRCCNCIHW